MVSFTSIAVVLALICVSAASDQGSSRYNNDKKTCGKLLQVPEENLQQYFRSEYPENHDTYCFIRCVAILQGHYEDEQGIMVDNLYEVANLGKTKEEFTELLNTCQEPGDEEIKCHCRKAFKPLMCFRKHYHEWRKTVASGEAGA